MRLVISDTDGAMVVVPLVRDEISIGRKEGNTIRLTERNISRQHCRLHRVNGSFLVRDLGSYNGVLLNGQRVIGEVPVSPGDEIRVGDYTLVLEGEAAKTTDLARPSRAALDAHLAHVAANAGAAAVAKPAKVVETAELAEVAPVEPPPRLIVLTPPIAGAEFSLPVEGELRVGRSSDLEITLEHRSVSREHAKIVCSGGEARIVDLGSVNGVIINGQKQSEAKLVPDDTIELGDILLRFVGAGQHFALDTHGVAALTGPKRAALIAAIVIVCVMAALFAVRWIESGRTGVEGEQVDPPPPARGSNAKQVLANAAPNPGAQRVALLEACRKASEAEHFAEAIAKANAALKLDANDAKVRECARLARANHEQEQVSVRAKAALQQHETEAAWREVKKLSPDGPVTRRSDVLATVGHVVASRLSKAEALLDTQPVQAAELAREAAALALISEPLRVRAEALADQADNKVQTRSALANRGRSGARPGKDRLAGSAGAPSAGAAPQVSAAPEVSAVSVMEIANACLARGDNPCVIHALNGRAETAQELGLLIETYRALGNVEQAYRHMAIYVQRFPNAKRSPAYRELLERTR